METTLIDFCIECGKKFSVLKTGNYTKKGTPLCNEHLSNFIEIEKELEEIEEDENQ